MKKCNGYRILSEEEWKEYTESSIKEDVKITDAQNAVVKKRDSNILVSAAAGSGKTWVLVKRIIDRLISERIDITSFLIVTFTNAAANEMRTRIADEINDELKKAIEAGDEDLVSFLSRQAALVNIADISTTDAFCNTLVKEHFMELGIDPSYRIGDDTEINDLSNEAISELMSNHYDSDDEDFIKLVKSYKKGRTDENIESLIKEIYDYQSSMPDADKWIDDCISILDNDDMYFEIIIEHAKYYIEAAYDYAKKTNEFVLTLEAADKNSAAITEDIIMLDDYKSMLNNEKVSYVKRYDSIFSALKNIPKAKTLSYKPLDDSDADKLKKMKKHYRDDLFKGSFASLFSSNSEELISDKNTIKPHAKLLLELSKEFRSIFEGKKLDKLTFEFSDIEHMALSILKTKNEDGEYVNTPVADELKNNYKEIMVDEYQDSNFLQEEILTSLVSDNMFMVGDRKQSIYRFRMARPELFNYKYNTYGQDDKNTLIELDCNFRSSSNVLQSINYIFDKIMHESIGDVEYDEAASLKPGASYPEGVFSLDTHPWLKDNEDCFYYDNDLEIAIYDKGADLANDDEALDNEEYDKAELDARTIALKIHNMMDPKHHYLVKDKSVSPYEASMYRPLEYRDIVIILRSVSGVAASYQNILQDSGIPTVVQNSKGFFEASEISMFLSLLETIYNPADDIVLTATMRHYFGGFDMEELGYIKVIFDLALKEEMVEYDYDIGRYHLYDKLKFIADCDMSDLTELIDDYDGLEALHNKIISFLDKMDEYISLSRIMSVSEFIRHIFNDSGYLDYCLALSDGIKRHGNLNMLLTKASQFENNGYKDLYSFIKYIKANKEYEIDFGEASVLSDRDNVVRIMSIHKSKGLEFPVVFVAGMDKQINLMDFNNDMLLSMDYGLALPMIDYVKRIKRKTIMSDVLKIVGKKDTYGEELRLLYVAMTRAKDKCILTGVTKDYDKLIESVSEDVGYVDLYKSLSYLDWVMKSLYYKINTKVPDPSSYKDAIIKLYHLTNDDFKEEVKANTESREEIFNELLSKLDDVSTDDLINLDEQLRVDYPYNDSTRLKTKFSVSEIKHHFIDKVDNDEEEPVMLVPKVEEDEEAKDINIMKPEFLGGGAEENIGAFKGTAIHKFMEIYDFNNGYSDEEYDRTIKSMKDIGIEDIDKYMPKTKLSKFFANNLGKEMANASKCGKLYKEAQFIAGLPAVDIYKDLDVDVSNMDDELVMVQGIVDGYYINDDGSITIMDYKTDNVKDLDALKSLYKSQLDYYERVLRTLTNREVKAKILYSFKFDDCISV